MTTTTINPAQLRLDIEGWCKQRGLTPQRAQEIARVAVQWMESGIPWRRWVEDPEKNANVRRSRRTILRKLADYAYETGMELDLSRSDSIDWEFVISDNPDYQPLRETHPLTAKLIAYLKAKGFSARTVQAYKSRINMLLVDFSGDHLQWLADAGGQSERVQRRKSLVSFHDFLQATKEQHPLASLQEIPKVREPEREPPVYVSREEAASVRTVMSQAPLREYTGWMLLYGCGLRAQELGNLKLKDVRLELDKQAEQRAPQVFVRRSKHYKSRYVPLPSQTVDALEQYLMKVRPLLSDDMLDDEYLLLGDHGVQYNPRTYLLPLVRSALNHVGIEQSKHPLHMWRHAFATHLDEQGVDIRVISQLLGHKSVATTEKYLAQVSPKRMRDAILHYSPLSNPQENEDVHTEDTAA